MRLRYIFIFLLLTKIGFAQSDSAKSKTGVVQPKIMVIPYTKEGEDIRTLLENDENKRIALTKIKEGFDSRGFTTVDFTAKLKAAKENKIFTRHLP
jgi:hypothetical protein